MHRTVQKKAGRPTGWRHTCRKGARRPKRGKEPEKKKAEKGQEARKEKTATAFGALRGHEAEKRGHKAGKDGTEPKGPGNNGSPPRGYFRLLR